MRMNQGPIEISVSTLLVLHGDNQCIAEKAVGSLS